MRVDVEWPRCEGHGLYQEHAPRVFELDDDGNLHMKYEGEDIPADDVDAVAEAVAACPGAGLRAIQ